MFDVSTINTSFSGLVGWRQSNNPLYTTLNAGLKTSSSGLYFNGLSAIDFDLIEYIVGEDYTDVNEYLEKVYNDCLASLLNKFVTQKKGIGEIKEVLENTIAQRSFDASRYLNSQQGRALGWEIRPKDSNNIRLQITSLGLMTNSIENITVYLYRANKKEAIFTKSISSTADNEEWTEVTDFIHYYQSTTEGAGQSLYLLMYEYDSINQTAGIQLSQNTKLYYSRYCNKSKFAYVRPIAFNSTYLNWSVNKYNLPNLRGISYEAYSHGLNFRYNLKCDITHILKDQVQVFAEALQYEVAIKLLFDGITSTRINETENRMESTWIKTMNAYKAYLYGYNDDKVGFVKGLMEKLILDFSGLDDICLPCQKFKIIRGHTNYK